MAIGKKFKRKIKPTHFLKMCYLVADVQHYQEYAIIGVIFNKMLLSGNMLTRYMAKPNI